MPTLCSSATQSECFTTTLLLGEETAIAMRAFHGARLVFLAVLWVRAVGETDSPGAEIDPRSAPLPAYPRLPPPEILIGGVMCWARQLGPTAQLCKHQRSDNNRQSGLYSLSHR